MATSGTTRRPIAAPDPITGPPVPLAPWPSLDPAAARAGIPLTPDQLARFDTYRRLLLDWNTRTNLTAITDPTEVERRLFLDALLMVPALDAAAGTAGARLVDVGSGAGFPGLALKIARPRLDVTLVEATGKKVAFLDHAIAELGLRGVIAIHARAEELGRDRAHRDSYDLATARAVASLAALLELCAPLLRVGGHALFPKGPAIAEELAAGRRAAPALGVRILDAAPLGESGTRLVLIEKTAPTPDRYPRRAGIPAREPLGTEGPGGRGAHRGHRDSVLGTRPSVLCPAGRTAR